MNDRDEIERLFPGCCNEYGFSAPGYGAVIASFGYEMLALVDDKDYQGDSRVLLRRGNEYGLLIFGWGSCSGCDALEACESYADLAELRRSLIDGIEWLGDACAAIAKLRAKDWDGTHLGGRREENRRFMAECEALLGGAS